MRRRSDLIVALSLIALAALASEPDGTARDPYQECAVLSLVAREHLGFDERMSPPLRASGNYRPECPWEELGVKIDTVPASRQAKLVFRRPRIDRDEAIVRALVIYGTLSGAEWECRLGRTGDAWELRSCRRTRAL